MPTLLRVFAAAILLLAATSVAAVEISNRIPFETTPVELPADVGQAVPWGQGSPQVSTPVYSALDVGTIYLPTGFTSPVDGLPYVEYADDCHLTGGGLITDFTIGYFEPGPGPVDVQITLYENDAGNTIIGPVIAGPYLFTGLPAGFNIVSLAAPDAPVLFVQDVWFAVQFTPDSAGLVNAPPPSPTVGTSVDVYLDTGLTPPPGLVVFDGNDPLANFMIEINVDETTLPIEQASWSTIKSLYDAR